MRREQRFLNYGFCEHGPDLPPLFHAVVLREGGDAFMHACHVADEMGAGTFVHVGAFGRADFAVVLEPEEPLVASRRLVYVGMLALADALAALAPPEKPIAVRWPDAVHVDGGLVGGGRLGWPAGSDEGAVPRWLVFGAMIRLAFPRDVEPGLHRDSTALEEEGFADTSAARLAESFARHFMIAADAWKEENGFARVAKDYIARLEREAGISRTLAANGDLLLRRGTMSAWRCSLAAVLAQQPSWLSSETGEPRL
jgi:biotin-(acetyl-CoA carboxylase) ligase